nr:epidermal growth factor-like protein 7 isoform X1 [Pogona vitticeps]XP_020650543.1 epidermal growth factor-like protein 7 isoform X1 [Pogona vitticeps]
MTGRDEASGFTEQAGVIKSLVLPACRRGAWQRQSIGDVGGELPPGWVSPDSRGHQRRAFFSIQAPGVFHGGEKPHRLLPLLSRPTRVPALPHLVPRVQVMQYVQNYLQGRAAPSLSAAFPTHARLLSRVEASRWAPGVWMQYRCLPTAVPKWRDVRPPEQVRLPFRVDGKVLRDVDECAGGRHGCSQACLNVAGSYRCACQPGYALQEDEKTCRALEVPTEAPATLSGAAGVANLRVQNEVQELRRRVAALEEKFQLALAPFLKLETPGSEGAAHVDPIGLLVHSLQQLDRIDSLSEQISFLEEQLETCSCKDRR